MSKSLIQDNLERGSCDCIMTREALLKTFRDRFRQRSTWAAILVFIGAWAVVRVLMGWRGGPLGSQLLSLAFFVFGHIFLSPLPWQWTRDDRPLASIFRGSMQALPWNALWLSLAVFLVNLVFPDSGSAFPHGFHGMDGGKGPLMNILPNQGASLLPILANLPFAMLLGWFLADKDKSQAVEADLREGERNARAQALQAQLHPHALYNVLSGLTELVHEDPDATEDALIKLTDLLRNLTHHGSKLAVPFSEEKALVSGYLEIESIRLASRLEVSWNWPTWADGLMLPPLLLQPLVENAIKHGISAHPDGGRLNISVSKEADNVILRVANSGMPMGMEAGRGVGITNLRDRLALMPSLSPTFSLVNEDDWTIAELRLRLHA